jgi:SAM-dependent methyltransferase
VRQSLVTCWCGNEQLADFGPEFLHCASCQTLVSRQRGKAADEITHVGSDEAGLYGKSYWFEHQQNDVGLPDITTRARADLPERCVHWLRTLLTLKLPPAKVLELGSAHGGFVAMLRSAGYDAAGLELSPYIVDFARQTFGVPMHLGPVEQQPIAPGSLDAIAMMDVLEHLPDPIGTMEHVASLLKPDGVLIAQTPRYPERRTFAEMAEAGDYFLNHMRGKAPEHLLLFSESSAQRLMTEVGLSDVTFDLPIFHQYDMYFVAAREPIERNDPAAQSAALQATPGGRLTQALLDATADRDLYLAEAGKRLKVIEALDAELKRRGADLRSGG